VRTVGVDLAAQPKKTAVAVVDWGDGNAVVDHVTVGQTDAEIIDQVAVADKAGFDCPLGWPEPFIDFLIAQRDGKPVAPNDIAARRSLAYRTTDLVLKAETGVLPLSVAADLIGHTAMRAAGILSQLSASGSPVDRSGAGVVVEVYPAAALRSWELYRPRYKGTACRAVREELVDDLLAALSELRIEAADLALCRQSDDALDAVLCAFIARAAALGKVRLPDAAQAKAAATEGWIAVPTCGLRDLLSAAPIGPAAPRR
jgi:predicted nuclease with RNAse H fold